MTNYLGSSKQIIIESGKVFKTPDTHKINPEQIIESIEFFKTKFKDFVPETNVKEISGKKIIEQEFIEGDTLKETKELTEKQLKELLDFINKAISILIKEGKFFDIIGYQGNQNFLKYKGLKKIYKHYQSIKNFFNSTNFVIGKNNVYFVDIVVTYGIFKNSKNTLYKKLYRLYVLFGYRKQILNKLKSREK